MSNDGYPSLSEAVFRALEMSQGTALESSSVLLGFLMDQMNPESVELLILKRNLDDALLAPFREELSKSAPDLLRATTIAHSFLVNQCIVDEKSAQIVAKGLAEGVAQWKGVKPDTMRHVSPVSTVHAQNEDETRRYNPRRKKIAMVAIACFVAIAVVSALVFLQMRQREQASFDEAAQTTVASPAETQANVTVADVQLGNVSNPRVVINESMDSGQAVTWDCLWFGSYPQTEIRPDDDTYASLELASWDNGNSTMIDGVRYSRLSREDATYQGNWSDDSPTYRYFRYDPIKWRVLKVDGDDALVLSDISLDCRRYNEKMMDVIWETSSIRAWLNGYGADSNACDIDFTTLGFFSGAFLPEERNAISQTVLTDDDNQSASANKGNNTADKVFLLSTGEIGGSSATMYGFAGEESVCDEARRCKASDFAVAMGAWRPERSRYKDYCWWWLRSPGRGADCASIVSNVGWLDHGVNVVSNDSGAVRPALYLDLSSPSVSSAGTVSSDDSAEVG